MKTNNMKNTKNILHKIISIFKSSAVIALFVFIFILPNTALAAIPQSMSYSAVLRDAAGVPLAGSYDFKVRYYDASTAGILMYEEEFTTTNINSGGTFFLPLGTGSVISGTFASINFNTPVFITLNTKPNANPSYDGEMNPRIPLRSVPYALNSQKLDGRIVGGANGVVAYDASSTINTNGLNASGTINALGNVNAGANLNVVGTTTSTNIFSTLLNSVTGIFGKIFLNNVATGTVSDSILTIDGITGEVKKVAQNFINIFTQNITGNTLTTNINGNVATTTIISSNNLQVTGSELTSTINGITATTSIFSLQGATGTQGIQGVQGLTGLTGATGTNGLNGIDGATGTQGIQGIQGIQGLTGLQGATGTTGLTGSQGTQGLIGLTGATGTNGLNGLDGATGTQGIQGLTGATGSVNVLTNDLATTTNTFQSIVNGISSLVTSIINSLTTTLSGNTLTTTVNGVSATSNIIGSTALSYATSTNILTSTINGLIATTSINITAASAPLNFASFTQDGIVSTTTQGFSGNKTFNGSTLFTNASTTINSGVSGLSGLKFAQVSNDNGSTTINVTNVFATTGGGPQGIVTDSFGNIYTANSGAGTVTKITPAGVSTLFATTGTQTGNGSIVIDAANNLYVNVSLSVTAGRIMKITPAGTTSTFATPPANNTVDKLTIDPVGNIYAAIYNPFLGDGGILKITPAGVTSATTPIGVIPDDILVDSIGNVYVTDSSLNNVTKITPAGSINILGTTGNSPRGMAIDAAGNIYVANASSNNVSKITPSGVSTILGTTGNSPRGIGIDTAGNIYTANGNSSNVTKITPTGISTTFNTSGGNPIGITIDANNTIYISNSSSNNISKISQTQVASKFLTVDISGNVVLSTLQSASTATTSTTNLLSSLVNTLTSNVNGIIATSSIINTNSLSFATTTNTLSSNINGVVSTSAIDQNILKYYRESLISPANNPVASGIGSISIGDSSISSGDYSATFGYLNTASGTIAHAFGNSNNVNGFAVHAFGNDNYVTGTESMSVGSENDVSGINNFAFGSSNTSFEGNSTLEVGIGNFTYGTSTSIFGQNNDIAGKEIISVGIRNGGAGIETSIFGYNNSVGSGIDYLFSSSTIVGYKNKIDADKALGFGSNNVIRDNSTSSSVFGDSNLIQFSNSSSIFGNNNNISNTSNASIFGFGITNNISGSTQFGPNNLAKFTVLGNGNIGIGTSTPIFKLDVKGDINIADTFAYKYNGVDVIKASTTLDNYFFGSDSGNITMTGRGNVSNGTGNLFSNTTGEFNVANGFVSLPNNTTGSRNTSNGVNSLYFNTTGSFNTANGSNSLNNNTTGSFNTANGLSALGNNVTGNNNTAIGRSSLEDNTTGSNNTGLGYNAQVPNGTLGNQIRLGDTNITSLSAQVALTVTSDIRYKENIVNSPLGLSFLNSLRPVEYERIGDISNKTEFGFIAQELEASLLSSSSTNSGIISTDSRGYKSVRYNDLFSPIVKGMQELDMKINNLTNNINAANTNSQLSTTTLISLLGLASTTNLISGNIIYSTNLDLNNYSLLNVKSISSGNGNWSISEDGKISAKEICVSDSMGVVCVNAADLRAQNLGTSVDYIINNGGSNGTNGTSTNGTSTDPGVSQATSSPVITIINNDSTNNTYTLGDTYVEHGATALDYDSTEITYLLSTDSSLINMNATGTFDITYTVISATSTLESVAIRSVTVIE